MDAPNKELKDRLKKAMTIKGVTPIELSEKTNIPKSSISQYMSGYTKPKQDRIYSICKALGITEAWLMGYDVEMEKNRADELTDYMIAVLDDKLLQEVSADMGRMTVKSKERLIRYAKLLLEEQEGD